ncbi:hypothetical protein DENIS_0816 [Desulfonema ishimotonii]|uniref:HPt domain-containing protein n=1 Tax=Desulfonema ishimotonii TaxID=45657 RepID=A0A401FSD8_9BACT|nr:Hpt domain-containing protein [Desulfonema ishimotonii]GBC59875.1 hypothetical protein DENIS_0816 [Desulfonema ishimotonii]
MLRAFDHDWDFFRECVTIFKEEYPAMLRSIREKVAAGDATGVRQTAHALRGMVGNFQATQVARTAQALEEMGLRNELNRAESTWNCLESEVVGLEQMLEKLIREEMG